MSVLREASDVEFQTLHCPPPRCRDIICPNVVMCAEVKMQSRSTATIHVCAELATGGNVKWGDSSEGECQIEHEP